MDWKEAFLLNLGQTPGARPLILRRVSIGHQLMSSYLYGIVNASGKLTSSFP